MSTLDKLRNADAAVLELSCFFIRHGLPHWPAKLSPTLESLRYADAPRAIDHWSRLSLLGEYGLMETRVSYDLGYRSTDMEAEQRHFERLLQQALDAMNNLRVYVRSGVDKPLLDIYRDVPL